MTKDRRASARDPEDMDVAGFDLGLDADEAPDPADAFGTGPSRQAAPVRSAAPARPRPEAMPEPDDLPEFEGDPFGGPPPFEAPVRSAPPAQGHRPDPGDWASMQEIGGSTPRGAGFGGGEPDGDPAEEFANFGGARSVASLGRRAEEPEPKGSYRAEAAGHDDVVMPFGDDEGQGEIPKGSLYREDETYEEGDGQEDDPALTLDDEPGPEEENADEQDEAKPSLVDRLKRFALPAAAAAAIGGGGYVGWTLLSPMLSSGDVAPIQAAAPIVPKQPVAGLPPFPPSAQAQQRPALPGAAAALPALPGQQPVSVPELPMQPRPVGLPQSSALPQASAAQLPAAQIQPQPFPAAQLPQAQAPQLVAALQPAATGFAPPEPSRTAAASAPSFGGGLNGRTVPSTDIESKLAAIASDLAALRGRQDEAARSAQSERDDLRNRMGDLERRIGETRRPQASLPDRDETNPRRAERVQREASTERQGRPDRRGESRAVYREASADDGTPPPKPKVVQGFSLKGVSRGVASVEGRGGVVEVGVGQIIPGVGEVKAIRRYGSDWVVVVGKGVIVQQ